MRPNGWPRGCPDHTENARRTLSHPHICALHDIGEDRDLDYLLMEYLEGESLAARIGKGRIALDEALPLAIGIVDALDHAHRAGIIHRGNHAAKE